MARIALPLLAIVGVLAVIAVLAVLASDAYARPGGGSSYSGGSRSSGSSSRSSGSSSSSGGGGGGLFQIVLLLLHLCIESPAVGIPIVLVITGVVVAVGLSKAREGGLRDWSVGAPNQGRPASFAPPSAPGASTARPELEELRETDEDFSVVLLEDFLAALYVEVHAARGRQALASLSAYVAPQALGKLTSPGIAGVRDIIVGAMRFTSVDVHGADEGPNARTRVEVELEANYTEIAATAPGARPAEQSYYVSERWRIARKPGVKSRAPDRARVFPCPSCGAPLNQVIAGVCGHCGQNVSTGAFDWAVEDVVLLTRESRGPMLTGTTEEQGTNLPTVVDAEAHARLRALASKDPSFDFNAFQARVALIFANFQLGWANRDLTPMRPFFTDNLFSVQAYWVEAYKRQHLRNITERARITGMHLARVTSDKWFDAITLRVFATGLDFTVTDDGRLVAGNKSHERVYTEYWTLVRGSSRKGPTKTEAVCPNCGAPLAVTMAGNCQYCQAKVCSGEFDWVLSRIEQDESYEG